MKRERMRKWRPLLGYTDGHGRSISVTYWSVSLESFVEKMSTEKSAILRDEMRSRSPTSSVGCRRQIDGHGHQHLAAFHCAPPVVAHLTRRFHCVTTRHRERRAGRFIVTNTILSVSLLFLSTVASGPKGSSKDDSSFDYTPTANGDYTGEFTWLDWSSSCR